MFTKGRVAFYLARLHFIWILFWGARLKQCRSGGGWWAQSVLCLCVCIFFSRSSPPSSFDRLLCVCCITKKRRREGYCVTAVRRNRLPASASRGMIERALLAVLAGLWGSRPGNADGDLTALPIVAIFAHPYNDRCGGVQAVVCRKEMHVCTSVPKLRTGSSFLNGAEGTFCVLRC